MPTAEDFTKAAALLRVQSEIAEAVEGRARNASSSTGITAGPYHDSAVRGAVAAAINAGNTSTKLNDAAVTFDERAVVCAEYTTAMDTYDELYADWQVRVADYNRNIAYDYASWPGQPPAQPDPPPSWVTRG